VTSPVDPQRSPDLELPNLDPVVVSKQMPIVIY